MLTVLSPAKTLDETSSLPSLPELTEPQFLEDAAKIAMKLRGISQKKLKTLLDVSDELAALNHRRFADWTLPQPEARTRPALLTFKGDVYLGLQVESFTKTDFASAQGHLRILSGLYGMLRPLDRIQPYRLEMGTEIAVGRRKNLHEFWRDRVTAALREELYDRPEPVLINLASQEYFSAVDRRSLGARIVSPVFKDEKNGEYKVLSFFAKRARGQMAGFIVRNRLERPEELRQFDVDGYRFDEKQSTDESPVFLRPEHRTTRPAG